MLGYAAVVALGIGSIGCVKGAQGSFSGGGRNSPGGARESEPAPPAGSSDAAAGSTTDSQAEPPSSPIRSVKFPSLQTGRASFDEISRTSMAEVLSVTLAKVDNEAYEIDGHLLVNSRDFLIAHETELRQLMDDYDTVGDYLESVGVQSSEDLDAIEYDDVLTLAETALQGSETRASLRLTSGPSVSLLNGKLALAGGGAALGCAATVVGTVAGTVGAAFACSASLGLACGAAGVIAIGSGIGAGVTCSQAVASHFEDGGEADAAGDTAGDAAGDAGANGQTP